MWDICLQVEVYMSHFHKKGISDRFFFFKRSLNYFYPLSKNINKLLDNYLKYNWPEYIVNMDTLCHVKDNYMWKKYKTGLTIRMNKTDYL